MKYGKTNALQNVNVKFNKGEVIALMGPNGSGKSTMLKSILGLVIPSDGSILVNNQETKNNCLYRNQIGYMPQIINYPENLKVEELFNIVHNIRNYPADDDKELYEEFKIREILGKYFGQLSGGFKQRVAASIAFLFNPDILILDEPTASLDPLAAEILKTKIRKSKTQNKLIIISSHIVSEMDELADRIIYLLDGSVILNKSLKEIKNGSGQKLGKVIAGILSKTE